MFALSKEHCTHIQKYPETPANLYIFTETEVKPGMFDEYEVLLSQIKSAEEADPEWPMAVRRTLAVGETTTFYAGRAVSKFAELDKWDQSEAIKKKFGEHYARELDERVRQCELSTKIYMAAFRPDLSRITTPSPTEN